MLYLYKENVNNYVTLMDQWESRITNLGNSLSYDYEGLYKMIAGIESEMVI